MKRVLALVLIGLNSRIKLFALILAVLWIPVQAGGDPGERVAGAGLVQQGAEINDLSFELNKLPITRDEAELLIKAVETISEWNKANPGLWPWAKTVKPTSVDSAIENLEVWRKAGVTYQEFIALCVKFNFTRDVHSGRVTAGLADAYIRRLESVREMHASSMTKEQMDGIEKSLEYYKKMLASIESYPPDNLKIYEPHKENLEKALIRLAVMGGGTLHGIKAKKEIELFIAAGASVNARDAEGKTALHQLAENIFSYKDPKGVAELLIAKGADVNAADNDGRAPLHSAANTGGMEIAKLLIAKGSDVNASDKKGDRPLHRSIIYGDDKTEALELLISKGADIDARSKNGWTPLHIALIFKHKTIAKFLIDKGANVNATSEFGGTPLHSAADEGFKDIVEILIARGVDVSPVSKEGWTPLHYAAADGHKSVVEFLLSRGAKVNLKEKNYGLTPLGWAKKEGHNDIVELLRKHGATE